jgi:hypothetical protein
MGHAFHRTPKNPRVRYLNNVAIPLERVDKPVGRDRSIATFAKDRYRYLGVASSGTLHLAADVEHFLFSPAWRTHPASISSAD